MIAYLIRLNNCVKEVVLGDLELAHERLTILRVEYQAANSCLDHTRLKWNVVSTFVHHPPTQPELVTKTFDEDLKVLINKHSMENGSDTPDFVLAMYLRDCLNAFNRANQRRKPYCGGVQHDPA